MLEALDITIGDWFGFIEYRAWVTQIGEAYHQLNYWNDPYDDVDDMEDC